MATEKTLDFLRGTSENFQNLKTKDKHTFYLVEDIDKLFLGEVPLNPDAIEEVYVGSGEMPQEATVQIDLNDDDSIPSLEESLKNYVNQEIAALREADANYLDQLVEKKNLATMTEVEEAINTALAAIGNAEDGEY